MNDEKLKRLGGRRVDEREFAAVEDARFSLPRSVRDALTSVSLCGATVTILPEDDLSQLGVDMRILTPQQMRSEALDCYPGIAAISLGYIPLAMCLEGSGDPYFVDADLRVVRIPHDAVDGDSLDAERLELVAKSLEDAISLAVDRP
ncbi:MAG: hypothetical protein U0271_16075 [Polyangiaceae bacterium]